MAAFDSDVDVTVEMAFRNRPYMETVDGYVSAPDSAGLSVTGDLDLRWFGIINNLTTMEQPLITKWAASPQRSYAFFVRSTHLMLDLSSTGVNSQQMVSTEAPPNWGQSPIGYRVTFRDSDNRIQFFYSDDGLTWIQVGADVTGTGGGAGPIFDSTAEVRIGGYEFNPISGRLAGRTYWAEIRSGIGGTVVGRVDFTTQGWQIGDDAGDTGSDGSNTWTLQGDAVVDDVPALFDPIPIWTDVSDQVKSASFQRGRSSVQDDFPAGSGELFLDNTDGDFYPWNTVSSHYPYVTVGVQVRITATHNSIDYPLFRGYVSRWPLAFPTNSEELARVEIVETFARLQDKKVSDSFAAQTTDERIGSVLDAVGWPLSLRDLESGVADVAARVWDKVTALFLMRTAVEAEQGQLFQAANGDLMFLNRVAASGAASQATFGPDGAELVYVDVTIVHDDDLLVNEALITGADGIEQSARDDASATVHGPVTYSTENLSITGAPAALNVAEWIVAKHKDIEPRIIGFVIDPAGSPTALWPEVLGRELRDIITVEVSYPGSAVQLVQAVAVESISHSFEAGGVWTVAYGCHPLSAIEQASYWILGTSQLGINTVLA